MPLSFGLTSNVSQLPTHMISDVIISFSWGKKNYNMVIFLCQRVIGPFALQILQTKQ